MFHLFERKYISLDAISLYDVPGEQRLYITDASFSVPLTTDANLQTVCGILGYYQNMKEVDEWTGDRSIFWSKLLDDKRSICIIASPAVMAELMIQLWKSLLAKHTVDSLYLLYTLYANNDNAQAFSERLKTYNTPDGTKASKRVLPILSKEDFARIYEATEPVELLANLDQEQVSFEFQLMGYLAGTKRNDVRSSFFKKLDRFVSKYLAQNLIDTASEIIENHGTLNLMDDNVDPNAVCPLCALDQIPQYKWIFTSGIYERDPYKVLREIGLARIAKIMQDLDEYRKESLFTSEIAMLFLLASKQYDEMVAYDIALGATSIFARKSNRTKVNPLLIGYLYRLYRKGRIDELKMFELK